MADRGEPCPCHGVPREYRGGAWLCVVKRAARDLRYRQSAKNQVVQARYNRTPKGRATKARSDRKRITKVGNSSIRAKTEEQAEAIKAIVRQRRQEFYAARKLHAQP